MDVGVFFLTTMTLLSRVRARADLNALEFASRCLFVGGSRLVVDGRFFSVESMRLFHRATTRFAREASGGSWAREERRLTSFPIFPFSFKASIVTGSTRRNRMVSSTSEFVWCPNHCRQSSNPFSATKLFPVFMNMFLGGESTGVAPYL